MSPPILLLFCLVSLIVLMRVAHLPFPIALAFTAAFTGVAGTLEFPFRHLVEGGFGYFNLILALFAGSWFGQAMVHSGQVEGFAAGLLRISNGRPSVILAVIAALLYTAGMFTGLAGVAVLVVGVFAVPVLRRIGLATQDAAAFIALEATCGMIAPPVNVPAMMIADGVNMPFENFNRTLLLVSVPVAVFTVLWFVRRCVPRLPPAAEQSSLRGGIVGSAPLAVMLGFWLALRTFPQQVYDPGVPLVLVVVGLAAIPLLGIRGFSSSLDKAFSGVPVYLAAALIAVGMLVQIMALTGIRGWVVIQTMVSDLPWLYFLAFSLPILGGLFTSAGTANILGVPFAFAFIQQDMIINVSALSSLAAIAEFMPPTAVGAALAGYVTGEGRLVAIIRAALPALLLLIAISMLLLVFARPLAPWLTS